MNEQKQKTLEALSLLVEKAWREQEISREKMIEAGGLSLAGEEFLRWIEKLRRYNEAHGEYIEASRVISFPRDFESEPLRADRNVFSNQDR